MVGTCGGYGFSLGVVDIADECWCLCMVSFVGVEVALLVTEVNEVTRFPGLSMMKHPRSYGLRFTGDKFDDIKVRF